MSILRPDAEAHNVIQSQLIEYPWLVIDRRSGRIISHMKSRKLAVPYENDNDYFITSASSWFADYKGGDENG